MNALVGLAQAGIHWSPVALGIAAAISLILILVLRFMVKTVFSLVKIAIIVVIGAGTYLAIQTLL